MLPSSTTSTVSTTTTVMLPTTTTLPPNDATPLLSPVGDRQVTLGSTLAFTLAATDPDCPTPADDCNPSTPEKDRVTFSVAPLPLVAHAGLNQTTGAFSFTPDANQVGAFDLTFMVSDGFLSASETIR